MRVWSLLFVLLLTACGFGASPASSTEEPAAEEAPPPLPEAEVQAFGERFAAAAAQGPAALAPLYDWAAMAERAAPDDFPAAERPSLVAGIEQGLQQSSTQMLTATASAQVSFRGVVEVDGERRARIRLVYPEAGFNYNDLVLGRAGDGSLKIVDLYVMANGELLSETMKRTAMLLRGPTGIAGLFGGGWRPSAADARALSTFMGHVGAGETEPALAAYEALAPRIKREPAVVLSRVRMAGATGDDERYLAAMGEAANQLPDNLALAFMMLDAYTLREDWPSGLHAVQKLRRVYPDSYLDAVESRLQTLSGDSRSGLRLADAAIAAEDGLLEAHDVALFAALSLGNDERAAQELQRLVTDFEVDPTALSTVRGYERVVELAPPPAEAPAD